MTPIRIHPVKMAEIYFNRLHFAAIREVDSMLRMYEGTPNSESARYWRDVLGFLNSKAQARQFNPMQITRPSEQPQPTL